MLLACGCDFARGEDGEQAWQGGTLCTALAMTRCRPAAAQVDLPGGPLHIEWREADNRIYMTGPAELVFSGSVSV